MTKQETLDLYSNTFPTAENPLTYSQIFSFDQIVNFAKLALDAGEPLEFEIIEEGLPVFMATSPSNSDLFMNAYRTGDYNKAIEISNNLPFTDTLNFYVGCSYLYKHDSKNAIHYLSKISEESEFYCNALYQKAFANANRKNNEEAITLLKELLNKDCSNYNEKADGFLKELTQ
jgi:tetratricopeptide (TPR) repeat protein